MRTPLWRAIGRVSVASIILSSTALISEAAAPLNPSTISKYATQLDVPPVYSPNVVTDPATGAVLRHDYTVTIGQFTQQMLPAGLPATTVWGYSSVVKDPASPSGTRMFQNAPGATFEATRGIPINVQWVNNLIDPATGAPLPHLFTVDPTLHWANPNNMATPTAPFLPPPGYPDAQSPVPIVMHLHGGEVESASDGNPNAWFTPSEVMRGPAFVKSRYIYANQQSPATLWYHDHTLGITRQNVYAGLAGVYVVKDPNDPNARALPSGQYDIPLVIQDKMFLDDGSLYFPTAGVNPDIHPYWGPEFLGDTIVVNGKSWPNLNVERTRYRFRVINGSNARFYNLALSNGKPFTQIASDGGYLKSPVKLNKLLIAPGERAELLIDFSELAPGAKVILTNDANAPFPNGLPVDPLTTGQVMQFTVLPTPKVTPPKLPTILNTIAKLTPNMPTRTLTLNEAMGPGGPVMVLLNGQTMDAPVTETPRVGSTEIWEIVNMTADTHPIHLHLVQFQLQNRQAFDVARYTADWNNLNGGGMLPLMQPTVALSPTPYKTGGVISAPQNEVGWKDTIQARTGEITRLIVRIAPQSATPTSAAPGVNLFSFDPTVGPGYVWHCHILDHEDNEMMRPLIVMP